MSMLKVYISNLNGLNRNNAALLASLGLSGKPSIRPHKPSIAQIKKPKLSTAENVTRRGLRARNAALKIQLLPTRRSGRVAALQSEESIK